MKCLIGTLLVKTPQVIPQSFETASWYRDHEIQPGSYPVYFQEEYSRGGLLLTLDTIIKAEYLGTMYGGVQVGSYTPQNIGKEDTLTRSDGFYSMAPELVPFSYLGDFTLRTNGEVRVGYRNERTKQLTTLLKSTGTNDV